MKTFISFIAVLLLAGAAPTRAAPGDGPVETGDGPLECLLHITAALHEQTRFTPDGATHLVWEDSLGRRTRAELHAGGAVVIYLPDGRIQRHAPSTRVPTTDDVERIDRVLAAFWERRVDLVGRRYLAEGEGGSRPSAITERVWDNRDGVWTLIDACEKAELAARNNCAYDCAQEGMGNTYKSGECGAGSSCTCVYSAFVDPFG